MQDLVTFCALKSPGLHRDDAHDCQRMVKIATSLPVNMRFLNVQAAFEAQQAYRQFLSTKTSVNCHLSVFMM